MNLRADEIIKSLEANAAEDSWVGFSSLKKAEYLIRYAPDCTFIVGSESESTKAFPCHKWIMQCVSPVFEAMFNGNFKESNTSKEIRVTDTDPNVFKKFLDFIYYGNEEGLQFLDRSMLRDLIYLGRKYMITSLTDYCDATIKSNLDNIANHNLISVFEYAYFIDDKDLIAKCKTAITHRCNNKPSFQSSNNVNIPKQNDKPPTLQANTGLNAFGFTAQSSPTSPFANFAVKDGADKKQAVKPIFDSPVTFGLNKGDITTCSYIYDLSPSIFNEFQKALKSFISELSRYNLIEMYAKINGVTGDVVEQTENATDNNGNINDNEIKKSNSEANNSKGTKDKEHNLPIPVKSYIHHQQICTVGSSKQILNMMLRTIDFHRMSPREFCNGPGKSNLLDIEEKYELLSNIVYKN